MSEIQSEKNDALKDKAKDALLTYNDDLEGDLVYPCNSCGKPTELLCEVDEFDPNYHYCGENPWCCP